jgi:hypothetical protein
LPSLPIVLFILVLFLSLGKRTFDLKLRWKVLQFRTDHYRLLRRTIFFATNRQNHP